MDNFPGNDSQRSSIDMMSRCSSSIIVLNEKCEGGILIESTNLFGVMKFVVEPQGSFIFDGSVPLEFQSMNDYIRFIQFCLLNENSLNESNNEIIRNLESSDNTSNPEEINEIDLEFIINQ
jgi:hypothetical protein